MKLICVDDRDVNDFVNQMLKRERKLHSTLEINSSEIEAFNQLGIITEHQNKGGVFKMLRSELLKKIIKEAVSDIEKRGEPEISKHVEIFKMNDIVANMHIGCNKNGEMEQNTEESKVLKLEWFASSLVDVAESDGVVFVFSINKWLDMSDRILK